MVKVKAETGGKRDKCATASGPEAGPKQGQDEPGLTLRRGQARARRGRSRAGDAQMGARP